MLARTPRFALAAILMLLPASELPAQTARTRAQEFLARHPGAWRVSVDPVTHQPSFVYGGRYSLGGRPTDDAGYEALARTVVDLEPELIGVPSHELVLRTVEHLQLSKIGSSVKLAVVFDQVVQGIPVRHASVSVLFDALTGDVLAIDTTAVPGARDAIALPRSSLDDVAVAARSSFRAEYGVEPDRLELPEPWILGPSYLYGPDPSLLSRGATLVYAVPVSHTTYRDTAGVAAQGIALVSAEGDLSVFRFERTAFGDLEGTVSGNLNLGPEPNTPTNQELAPLGHVYVRQGTPTGTILATTDALGEYSIPTGSNLELRFLLEGPWAKVTNLSGSNASTIKLAMQGVPDSVLFNPAMTQFTTAEVAGFYWTNAFHDWVKAVEPTDVTMDFQANVRVSLGFASCNASYGGSDVTFYVENASCFNTAFNDIVRHEMGHWANMRYNGFGSQGAFEEGNADSWSYLQTSDPCFESYTKPLGGCGRHAEQTAIMKCPTDGDVSCHGGASHLEGQALASAHWAVRTRLVAQLGAAAGDAVVGALFLDWMRAFDDKGLLNVIEEHWLALDDDDGDLSNLTPHYAQIDGGFRDYGWPGHADPQITVLAAPGENAGVPDNAPVTVTALLTSSTGPVTAADVRYSVDGGAPQVVAMVPTATPDEWTASIPAIPSPADIMWYVRAETASGNSNTAPASAPPMAHIYHSGVVTKFGPYQFDGVDDEGFTSVVLVGASSGEWERGDPSNSPEPTDPVAAFSGTSIFGTDLGLAGGDGQYPNNSTTELRTPVMDLSSWSNVRLQFRQRLALPVPSDNASVHVNDTSIWQAAAPSVLDQLWTFQEFDVTALAAGNPAVRFSWRIQSNSSYSLGGWNLDDVLVYRVDPTGTGEFIDVGNGLAGNFTPHVTGSGSLVEGQDFAIDFTNLPPATSGWVFLGFFDVNVPFLGGILVPDPNVVRLFPTGAGSLTLDVTTPAGLPSATEIFLQMWIADAGGPAGASATNGLKLVTP